MCGALLKSIIVSASYILRAAKSVLVLNSQEKWLDGDDVQHLNA